MPLAAAPLDLDLDQPFRIAHGTSTRRQNVLVRLDGGLGEAALPPYYPHDADEVLRWLHDVDAEALLAGPPWALEHQLDRLPPGPAPARAALDVALHDRWARHHGRPLHQILGLDPDHAPPTSITFAIPEDHDALREQLHRYRGWPVIKLKLGSGDPEVDEAVVRAARAATDAQLCVDANGAWTLDEAAQLIPRLAAHDVLFVEEPLGERDPAAWHALRRRLPPTAPPVVADERIQSAEDVLALHGAVDGVNVKLAKTGGIRGARRLIALARLLGLQVMLGCMVESAVAVTAAAHLAPLADYADLDAPLLLAADPFRGVTLERGRLSLPDGVGLGVHPADPSAVETLLSPQAR